MRSGLLALVIALLLLVPAAVGSGRIARADNGPTTAVPPPGIVGTPIGPPVPMRPMLSSEVPEAPSDYHFTHFQLYGMFFNPGEQVTITADHINLAPVTVTADQGGQFFAYIDFTWMFCGPGGLSDPAPVFHAAGNLGSSDTLAIPAPPCPELVTARLLDVPPPGGLPGGGVISGTAVAGTAIPVPVQVSTAVPPGAPSTPVAVSTPQPLGITAIETTNTVQGFGFLPGEGVSVSEINSPGDTPTPVSATDDNQGHFQATMQVYVPGPCMSVSGQPEIVATGDKGTTASARPAYPPMPMYPCIAPEPTISPSGPPTVVPPVVPTPQPGSNVAQPSVSLKPKVASPGTTEIARIQAPAAGSIRLAVTYPHRSAVRWTVTAPSSAPFNARWPIPRTVRPGRAKVDVLFPSVHTTLRRAFTIK